MLSTFCIRTRASHPLSFTTVNSTFDITSSFSHCHPEIFNIPNGLRRYFCAIEVPFSFWSHEQFLYFLSFWKSKNRPGQMCTKSRLCNGLSIRRMDIHLFSPALLTVIKQKGEQRTFLDFLFTLRFLGREINDSNHDTNVVLTDKVTFGLLQTFFLLFLFYRPPSFLIYN